MTEHEKDRRDAERYRFLRTTRSAPLAVTKNKRVLRFERLDEECDAALARSAVDAKQVTA